MNFTQSSVCILIEGVGASDGTGNTGGILWAEAGMDSLSTVTSGGTTYDVEPYLIDVTGRATSTSEPFRARASFSSYNFELDGRDEIAERLLYEPNTAVAEVASAIASGDSTADLTGSVSVGSLYYINEETIKVTADNGSGNYSITRGLYGSTAQAHGKNANVFDAVPDWNNRMVTLFTYDRNSDTLTERWRGRITKSNKQVDGTVHVFTREVLQAIKKLRLNREPNTIKADEHGLEIVPRGQKKLVVGNFSPTGKIRKASALAADTHEHTTVWQIGDRLYAWSREGRVRPFVDAYDILDTIQNSEMEGDGPTEPPKPIDDPLYECFVIDRRSDATLANYSFDPISTTADLADVSASVTVDGESVTIEDASLYPYHPLAIVGALLLSSRSTTSDPDNFDVFQAPKWGANLKPYFADDIVLRLHEMIQATQWIQVDQEVLGADGDPVAMVDVLFKKYLKPWGFDIGSDKNGRLNIYYTGLFGADEFTEALSNKVSPTEAVHDWSDGAEDTVSAIEVKFGGHPWRDDSTITVSVEDNEEGRSQNLDTDPDLTLDFSTIAPENEQYIRDIVTARALVQSVNIPRFRFQADDWANTGGDYGLGARLMLQDLVLRKKWALDKSGTRVKNFNDDIAFAGIVVGAGPDWQKGNFELDVLVIGDKLIRKRAHAAVIDASGYTENGDGTATFTLKANSFGAPNADASYFDDDSDGVGDAVQVMNPDGTLLEATAATVTAVSGNTVTVDATWAGSPAENMLLVPAFVDTDNSGSGYYNESIESNVTRPWVALADSDGTLGDKGDDADVYGG